MKITLSYPIKPVFITQRFGETAYLSYYQANGVNFIGHNGIDFLAYYGQPVYAAHDGTAYYEIDDKQGRGVVIITNEQYDYGNELVYYKSIYWHLCDSIKEPKFSSPVEGHSYPGNGLQVKRGDLIGYANSTGLSTADHLHFGWKPVAKTGEPPQTWTNINQNNGYQGAIDPSPYFDRHQFKTDMNFGDNDQEVRFLQDFLIMNGLMAPIPSAEYGIYGRKTATAVSIFQFKYKIARYWTLFWNGGKYIGPLTRYYLNTV